MPPSKTTDAPILEVLTHRLAECPEEFLRDPKTLSVTAIAQDHLRAMGLPQPSFVCDRQPGPQQALIAIAVWLLHDPWFLARPDFAAPMQELLDALRPLADAVPPHDFVTDPERREELVRFCLDRLQLRPDGESVTQAKDRLAALDSIERVRVLRDTQRAEERAQEVRKQMAKRLAEEAAAKATRE